MGTDNAQIHNEMTGGELRKLKRLELLKMMVALSRENDALRSENAELKAQLDDRSIKLQNAGSIAEASLRISGVFQAAQDAADRYLENITGAASKPVQQIDSETPAGASPTLRSTLASESESASASDSASTSDPASISDPASTSDLEPAPASEPTSAPMPEPATAPAPDSTPATAPAPTLTPDPVPVFEPEPALYLQPEPVLQSTADELKPAADPAPGSKRDVGKHHPAKKKKHHSHEKAAK